MPEAAAPPAAPAPTPLNSVSDALATAAHATARSPLEASQEQAAAARAAQPAQARISGPATDQPNLDSNALERARAADIARARGEQPAAPAAKPDAAAEAAADADPSVANEPWKAHGKRSKRTASDWETVKSKYEGELADMKKQLEAARTGTTNGDVTKHPEFAKLKQQHDEYLDALKQVSVERDPEFKARFEPRREAVLSKIRQVAGGSREKVEALLRLPAGEFRDSAIEQALNDFQPSTRATIMGQLQVLAMVDAERDAELASRKALYETNQQQAFTQQSAAVQAREQKLTAALDKQIAAWSDPEEGHPLLQHRDGDERWNRQVDKRVALARSIFNGEADPVSLSQAALKAAAHDAALEMAFEATREVARLTEQLNKLNGLAPGDGSGMTAASIMQTGRNDALVADPFDPRYVNHFGSGLEEARRADYAAGGGSPG